LWTFEASSHDDYLALLNDKLAFAAWKNASLASVE
jgi:hypothetical protein